MTLVVAFCWELKHMSGPVPDPDPDPDSVPDPDPGPDSDPNLVTAS